ncbi:helix-turn-helix domain-containing protein [Massilia sp. RP-1-19]|uniref:Helix-turn-helix domain-containing protein n=1 Tax=Massilia polaris TaxID=2728846 RepID=A0A848HM26_9BURK|nr:helix-turn-helix domain-containing protein [Massilia polaris]
MHQNGFIPLSAEIRVTINTDEAAFHLGRKPQTLRKWACYEDGPLRPVRINGRLAWRIGDIQRVLNEGSAK